MTLSIATPTATLIGYQENEPHNILVMKLSGAKKFNFLSGKVDLASRGSYQAAIQREFSKKCGSQGATLKDLKPFAVATDPYRVFALSPCTCYNLSPVLESKIIYLLRDIMERLNLSFSPRFKEFLPPKTAQSSHAHSLIRG
jgi:hypothetical protein